ncbi:PPE family protein [Mycolicibacter sp. MYC123]|uniref:PPE family protein n=1 Tax=[Mycobacterium] zoologicum TaxID=2872311 RepID=A0ABU5YJ88_9MYCO|nr:PPE family protein [Mycolicibacter sp. MYC123]MEB3050107.1 PPE family protein [Mycolicibacter sp. MYC123]
MDFALLPPEVNSGRMYTGPGAAPMLAAAAAWDVLAAELESAAAGWADVIAGLTGHAWSGSSAVAMVAAATPYATWLQAGAAKAEQTAAQAKTVAAAFEAAFGATVPPAEVAANRTLLATLVATNFFGQNTPAIAATEAHYAEMWAQDAVAMYGYAATALSASVLPQHDPPPQTTRPSALSDQSAAVSLAAGRTGQAVATQLAQNSAAPATGFAAVTDEIGQWSPFTSLAASGISFDSSLYTVVANGASWGRLNFVRGGMEGALTFGGLGPRGVLSASTTPVPGPGMSLGMGRATPVGGLSVPPSWASAAPEVQSRAFTLAAAETRLPVPAAVMPPGTVFQESMMGTTVGQNSVPGESGDARRGRKQGGKDDDQDGTPMITMTNGNGWLGASMAYHNRRRDAAPLPAHWRTG